MKSQQHENPHSDDDTQTGSNSTCLQQYMPPEVVSALIDKIVPPTSQGGHITAVLESMGCAEGRVDEYENVWIGRYSDECVPLKPDRDSTATIAFDIFLARKPEELECSFV